MQQKAIENNANKMGKMLISMGRCFVWICWFFTSCTYICMYNHSSIAFIIMLSANLHYYYHRINKNCKCFSYELGAEQRNEKHNNEMHREWEKRKWNTIIIKAKLNKKLFIEMWVYFHAAFCECRNEIQSKVANGEMASGKILL